MVSEWPEAASLMRGYNRQMNVKKLILVGAVTWLGFFCPLWFVIRFGATKETTWVDTLAIPAGLAFVLVAAMILTIFTVGRFKDKR